MKTRYILLAFTALAMSACARNVEPAEPEGIQMTFMAYQEGAAPTKSTVLDGGTQVYWEPSDEIKVFFNGSSGRFISQNTENATSATFTGTLPVVVGGNEGAGVTTKTWGLYPYRADAVLDGDVMVTTLPAAQTGREGSFAKNTNITLAHSEGYGLAFYNVCGGLRFSLTQEGIKRITFEGNNGEALAGKIKIAFEDGVPVVSEVVAKDSVLTLTAPNGGTFQTGVWYYLSAIPGTLSGGYRMVFYKESESAKLTSTSSVRIKRGIFGSLADADEDLVFKPTGGGDEPNPEDVIQFADPIAKYACVEKFDTNGDGEVSYAEAAAATSLSGLFTNWNTVTEFDEIRYFIGVTSTEGVFSGLSKLKHITIPDNITTLGTFQNCTDLETVVLPTTLSSLPTYCFDGCTSLTSVLLPTYITHIPSHCFRNCSSLITLVLPSTLTSLGQYAFYGCTALTSIELPAGLQSIGDNAFCSCRSLASMDFPGSLVSIGSYAFSGCGSFSLLNLSSLYSLISIGSYAFSWCDSLITVSVGSGVSLGSYAFMWCSSLESVVLEDGVSVGQFAFYECQSLVSVVLPKDMISIPASCFKDCYKLSSITWPDALTTVEDNAFEGCGFRANNFTLRLPSSITTIGSNPFGRLHHLVLPSTSPIVIAPDSFINNYTFLYVPESMIEMYKVRTNWSYFAERMRPIGDYPVDIHIEVGGTVGEPIDLGLSVKWASWNVGASSPEEFGDFFAWGETEPSPWGNGWDTYKWCEGNYNSLTKYNSDASLGIIDNKTVLELEDDAAHINWGGSWRIPTIEEIKELYDNCYRSWTSQNGVYGYKFTSKKPGFTNKSIFLPAAGRNSGSVWDGSGNYWSSVEIQNANAGILYFSSKHLYWNNASTRDDGLSIRPVCE